MKTVQAHLIIWTTLEDEGMQSYVSVNSNWVHPPGDSLKKLPRGSDLTFEGRPGAENSTRAGILWKVQTMLNAI